MTSEQQPSYITRDMRPATAPARWKYVNEQTGRVEFHATEQTAPHLRLVRAPASRFQTKATTPTKDDSDG